jgi:hypothetical protein
MICLNKHMQVFRKSHVFTRSVRDMFYPKLVMLHNSE